MNQEKRRARARDISDKYDSGLSVREIANQHNLTTSRIYQIKDYWNRITRLSLIRAIWDMAKKGLITKGKVES